MRKIYVPRAKSELCRMIFESGKWNRTKAALRAMDAKDVRKIFMRIRQEQFIELQRRTLTMPTTQETE